MATQRRPRSLRCIHSFLQRSRRSPARPARRIAGKISLGSGYKAPVNPSNIVPEEIMSSSTAGSETKTRTISVAHSPDSDDAFMFYALPTNKVRVPGLKFEHTLCDIETLNRKAMDGVYDVTAISFHAYPYIQDKYALMPSGG